MIDPSERRVETEAGSMGADFLLVALKDQDIELRTE
jgi:hypothetical protein